ncbi:hypothetical protein BD410DRAFT_809733 [Rickenella mellea]|uniref:Hydrophobic surface binding protein n=1 Tax=Rickenella mellea TaxID=50990 RepID=A0A4Y7PGA5_9AGAM|nr:hypothetical protein BD410DRAFT_809733 [Rickenella mellea]
MRFQSALLTLVVVASAAIGSPSFKRDGVTVLADVNGMGTAINDFNTACVAFPSTGGTLPQANNILAKAKALGTAINKGTTDATASVAYTESQSAAIVTATKNLEGPFATALGSLEAKKAALLGLPVGGIRDLIINDLNTLKNATNAFGIATLHNTSDDQQGNGQAVLTLFLNGFISCIAFFSS